MVNTESLFSKRIEQRIIKKTPETTSVAAWINAETGVGLYLSKKNTNLVWIGLYDKLNAPITENFSLKERLRILPKGKVSCVFFWKSKTLTCKFSRNKIYNFAVLPIHPSFKQRGIFSYLLKNIQQHIKIIIQRRQNVSRTLLLQNRSGVAQ